MLGAVALLLGSALSASAQSNDTGSIVGRVRNEASGLALKGASVSLSGTERFAALTNEDGTFRLNHVPAGQHNLVVKYTGLNPGHTPVTVVANKQADVSVDLSSEIYSLETFQVSTVREGQAAAINEQKNASNVVNIVSVDAFGNVADTNVANLLMKLPGISPERDEAEAYQVSIRGIGADLNSVSVDGTLLAGATTRDNVRGFELDKVSTNSIESIEVIKAPTPDHDADAIGGKINLRTKSGFDSNGRTIRYTIGSNIFLQPYARGADGVRRGDKIARAEAHPSASLNYSDVLGEDKRWAVTFNASFNRTFSPRTALIQGWDNNTLSLPHPKYTEFTTTEDDILLDRLGLGGKIHFKLSDNTTLFLNVMYNDFNDDMTQHKVKLQGINQAVDQPHNPPMVRDLIARIHIELEDRIRTVETGMVQVGGRTKWRDYEFDYDLSTSTSYGTDEREAIQLRVPNLGFRIDRTDSIYFPTLEVTSGNPANFASGTLPEVDRQKYQSWDDVTAGQFNARRDFNTRFPSFLKTGLRYRGQEKRQDRHRDRWAFTGPKDVLNTYLDDGRRYFPVEGRYDRWIWPSMERIYDDLDNRPELYTFNPATSTENTMKDDWTAGEKIYATYLMGSVKTGNLTSLVGVRVERTETYGSGVKEDLRFNAGDPRRYGTVEDVDGSYTNYFPGVHFRYEAIPNLVFRGSFSTSIGRPNFTKLIPAIKVRELNDGESPSGTGDPIPRVEINNPDIKPQFSDNFDLSAEYYLKGVGAFTLGVFRKNITDFIFNRWDEIGAGPDNGFGGLYEGYALKTTANGGWARVDGLELSYQQQLTFLPSPFDGLGVYANGTFLNSKGTYDESLDEIRYEIKGFTKRSANAGISYIKYGVTARASLNFNGPRLTGYNEFAERQFYDGKRTSIDLSLAYALPRWKTSVFLDINNLTNAKRTRYKGREELQNNTQLYGMRITAGLKGEF
jgi:TonB-dependent receptor